LINSCQAVVPEFPFRFHEFISGFGGYMPSLRRQRGGLSLTLRLYARPPQPAPAGAGATIPSHLFEITDDGQLHSFTEFVDICIAQFGFK